MCRVILILIQAAVRTAVPRVALGLDRGSSNGTVRVPHGLASLKWLLSLFTLLPRHQSVQPWEQREAIERGCGCRFEHQLNPRALRRCTSHFGACAHNSVHARRQRRAATATAAAAAAEEERLYCLFRWYSAISCVHGCRTSRCSCCREPLLDKC